ncbi:hypothetical protein D1872_281840 [compost metagenome]
MPNVKQFFIIKLSLLRLVIQPENLYVHFYIFYVLIYVFLKSFYIYFGNDSINDEFGMIMFLHLLIFLIQSNAFWSCGFIRQALVAGVIFLGQRVHRGDRLGYLF